MAHQSVLLISSIFLISVLCGYCCSPGPSPGVKVIGGRVQCETLSCPPKATACVIRKKNNASNPAIIDISRRCVADGITLLEKKEQIKSLTEEVIDEYVATGSGIDPPGESGNWFTRFFG